MNRYQVFTFTIGLAAASTAVAKQEALFATPVDERMALDGNTQLVRAGTLNNFEVGSHISMLNKQEDLMRFNVEPSSSANLKNHGTADASQVPNKGLTLLAALGLVILQLRRKHKSLPQRPIATSSNARTALPID